MRLFGYVPGQGKSFAAYAADNNRRRAASVSTALTVSHISEFGCDIIRTKRQGDTFAVGGGMNEQQPFTAYSAGSIAYSHKQTDYVTPHRHDYTEVVYYIRGKGLTNIYGETLYNFRFDEDSIVVSPPRCKHDEYAATETEIVCNQVDVEGDAFINPRFFKKSEKTAELFSRIKSRMLEINRLYCLLKTGPDRDAETRLDELLSRLGIDLCCLISQSEKGGKYYYTDIVTAVKSYIRKHFDAKIDFSILTESFGYSYDRFRHIFYEYTGMTLYAFQQGLRFNYAKQQLTVTDMKIAEIAVKTGLGSSVRFCEWFGKMAGVSPLKYRDMNKRLKWGVILNLFDVREKERIPCVSHFSLPYMIYYNKFLHCFQ